MDGEHLVRTEVRRLLCMRWTFLEYQTLNAEDPIEKLQIPCCVPGKQEVVWTLAKETVEVNEIVISIDYLYQE